MIGWDMTINSLIYIYIYIKVYFYVYFEFSKEITFKILRL